MKWRNQVWNVERVELLEQGLDSLISLSFDKISFGGIEKYAGENKFWPLAQ
jgi:hypothetical protein